LAINDKNIENGRSLVTLQQLQLSSSFFLPTLRAKMNGATKLEWGQLVAWLFFGEMFPLCHWGDFF